MTLNFSDIQLVFISYIFGKFERNSRVDQFYCRFARGHKSKTKIKQNIAIVKVKTKVFL